MKNFFGFLRCAASMVMMMAWMMPAMAQHPFTLTTEDDVTNGTETLYWIESKGASGFYAIPHTDNSYVSTTNMPNLKALWYFMDAGTDSKTQYYYIVNHNTGYYLKLDGLLGDNNTIKIASFGSGGDAYKFSITGSDGQWVLYPKSGNGSYWVNKRGGNVSYSNYFKSSNYGGSPDANSKWNFVAENSVTWAHPFTNSTNSETNYYLIHNATSNGDTYYMSTDNNSDPYATVSNASNSKRIWYFVEAASDNTIPNLKYYYIVNAVTGKYLKFTGTANGNEQTNSLQLYEHSGTETGETENRFQFMVLNAKGDAYSAYSIMPKLEISYYYNKNASLSPESSYSNSLSNDMKIGIYNDRGQNSNYAHWVFVATDYVAIEAPTITNNDGTITLSTATPDAKIYYTIDGTTPSSSNGTLYESAFSLGSATVIKAITYLDSEYSDVTTYNVPRYPTPTISFNNSTSEVTITSAGTVYYNTGDGSQSDPTPSSGTLYSAPFTVSSDITVKAIATHAGYLNSDVATWSYTPSHDYSKDYLTFSVLTDGTIAWNSIGSGHTETIQYSKNGGAWTNITASSTPATIDVSSGDKVRFKGNNSTYATDKSNYAGFEGGTATFDIEGNIMSLLYGDSFAGNDELTDKWTFCSLFKKALVISAENLILPALTLKDCCYRAMFSWCTTLEVAPALPATTLASYCYYYMFEKCAITSAPELPAPTLVSNCYANMFTGCTSLNYIKCVAVNISASGCLSSWVNNVASTGTFVKDGDPEWPTGASGIPYGWDVSVAAPEAPVVTCDGDFITITCLTPNASIYYRLGETGDYSSYSALFAINENTVVEAYAEKNELRSDTISEYCIAIKSYRFAGMEITPGPLYYGSNGYEIKDGWNYDSYNSIYGKTVGSTYFNFIELGQLFESSVFSTSDGDIEKVLDPLDGWRVPTNAEWASILGTTRSGSTVNGSSSKHYAMIQLTTGVSGLLIFPDGETITGVTLSNMDNTTTNTGITESQLDGYLGQGCIFLHGSGYYNGSWNNGHYYWSSKENNSTTGYDLHFEPSNTISSTDYKNKGTYYFPVYLVKAAADEATRLLRTWTYNGNEVELPYSVNAIDGHSSSYANGTFEFTTDVKLKASQRTYLWFQHADQSAAVYVDGTFVKKHWGGYNAFFVDITDYVHLGTNNIKVAIKNNEGTKLAPCAGDFNFNATLGEVKLISSPVVPDTVYGYDGFHITSTVTAKEATITVKTKVPTGATLTCSINGTNCEYSNTQTSTGEETTFTKTITDPHLWNGTLDPYLYDVTLTIAKDGVVYHTFKRGYGLRFFEYVVDGETPANSRFYLNGSPYLLRGVCMHHDLEGKANALTAADIDNDFEILKELGCNFVRLAHYPHPKEVYDHCDKMGLIVQTEVPCVNRMQSDLPVDYYNHLTTQYKDMVNQYFNHPCIVFWGLSNETTTDDKDFAKEKINEYITLIKSLDSSRLVGYVMSHSIDDPSGYYNDPDADWFGCNIYVGWYIDPTSNNPTGRLNTRLDKTLTRLSKPLAFSEYGCGGSQHCHSEDPWTTTTKGTNQPRHDIEYLMWLHEGHIAAIKDKPQLLFTSQWQLFDIAVYNRQEGYKVCLDGETVFDNNELKFLNNKGLVERDHKTKKDPFYLYKAWWNQTDKFVHICGKDYKKTTDRVIKCYTNDGSTLTLYVNNTEIETATVTNNIATFTAKTFTPGDVIRVAGDNSDDTFTIANYNVFTTEGNWDEASNWSAGAVPAAGCDVDILANATVPSDCTANVGNVTLYGSSTLTIEDGGQLYHNNEGVTATMQKSIAKYTAAQNPEDTETDRWHMIGSPVAESFSPSSDNGFLTNEYDLYYYHEPTQYWRNYKASTNNADPGYDIEPLKGYLYANTQDVTLDFEGSLRTGNATVNVPLSYTSDAGSAKGFNLIGNPFAHDVTGYTGTSVASECYRMNGTNTELIVDDISVSNPLKTGEGFFVKATAENASITFNSDAKDRMTKTGRINLEIRRNNRLIDRLIMKSEGEPLEKLSLQKNSTRIFAMRDNKEMAVVPIDGNEQDIYFETAKNGTYTLTVSETLNSKLSTLNFKYLHLIDNQTGADVDLLQTPSYSFKAKTMDDADRFKLVFVCGDANNGNKTFAFISNGNIIITADVEGATLQVIDVMGRVIVSREGDVSGSVSTNGMAAGTYILRLISSNSVMTQKIVIR